MASYDNFGCQVAIRRRRALSDQSTGSFLLHTRRKPVIGPVAQRLEHPPDKREVCGSIPHWPTSCPSGQGV
jgi:hypothetical protein